MAKGKNQKSGAAVAPPKCNCDDPYQCNCGNRPERPSRGHKWYPDDQIWAGKGHKQKGASGQTATKSEPIKITATGKTKVAQWQRLPTQLLQEYCQNHQRPNPTYQRLGSGTSSNGCGPYRYRCVLPDPKQQQRDSLVFIPAQPVQNEEQAQQESALLALLQVTRHLPHERKLPEPYKTTWLNAIQATPSDQRPTVAAAHNHGGVKSTTNRERAPTTTNAATSQTPGAAVASTHLTRIQSPAERQQEREERRRQQNVRIRRHEQIRQANQNHPVFMSVVIRQQIERLLRGESGDRFDDDNDDDDPADEEEDAGPENAVYLYVTQRLFSEGFSKRQAKSAWNNNSDHHPSSLNVDHEGQWDRIYEECLQWLLVHLNEDQLPEGFDPRGRTLDVVIPVAQSQQASTQTPKESDAAFHFAKQYGMTVQEASLIMERSKKETQTPEEVFWRLVTVAAGTEQIDNVGTEFANCGDEIFNDEIEALVATFDSTCTITDDEEKNGCCRIRIDLADGYQLQVVVARDRYPNEPPKEVLVTGPWSTKTGVKLHTELAKFISDLPLGEQMIFSIQIQANELVQSVDGMETMSLLSYLGVSDKIPRPIPSSSSIGVKTDPHVTPTSKETFEHRQRPRGTKKTFWTALPRETAPAVPFPKVSLLMERTRQSLPAFHSRSKFLEAIKEAERNGGRVVLVTGETGSGLYNSCTSCWQRCFLAFSRTFLPIFPFTQVNRLSYRRIYWKMTRLDRKL